MLNELTRASPLGRHGLLVSLILFAGCVDPEPSSAICGTQQSAQAATGGQCKGTATSCSSLSAINCVQEGCDVDIGAYDDPYDDRCEGSVDACAEMDSITMCQWQKGCTWEEGDDTGGSSSNDDEVACDDDDGGGSAGAPGVPTSGGQGGSTNPSGSGGGPASGGAGGVETPAPTSGAGGGMPAPPRD